MFVVDFGSETQSEAHARVTEIGDGVKRNFEQVGNMAETQNHRKSVFGNMQFFKLVLQDDRHFFGVLVFQKGVDFGARVVGAKSDIKMLIAGKSLLFDNFQSFGHNVLERFFNQFVIVDFVDVFIHFSAVSLNKK